MATDQLKVDLLYKKFLGVPDAFPLISAASEASGSARPRIIPSLQVFQQSIPAVAPIDVTQATFTALNGSGEKWISTSYPYIVNYRNLKLYEVNPGISYRYNTTNDFVNLLSNAIPFNYDIITSSYKVVVKNKEGFNIQSNDSTYPWIFDPDSGYLTFVGVTSLPTNLTPPTISFWRYEGTFGVGGGGGDSTWITNNLINAPPPIVYGDPVSKSNAIYIPWTYPTQINVGFLNKYLPEINTISSYYKSNLANITTSGNILSNTSGDPYIYNYSSTTIPITGIVLIKKTPSTIGTTLVSSGSVASVVFPQDNANSNVITSRNAFIYNDTNIATLSNSAVNTLTTYYQNFNTNTNLANIIFNAFLQSGVPSEPLNLIFSSSTTSSISVSFNAPTYGDLSNPDAITPIINYKIGYSTVTNTTRFGGIVDQSGNTTVTSAGNNAIPSLYPETSYLIYTSAQNNVSDSYGNVSANITEFTANLDPAITTLSPLTFGSISQYTGKNIAGLSITPIILKNTTWASDPITFTINESSNRGLLGTLDLANISITISGAVNLTGPIVSYNGFPIPATVPTPEIANSITYTTNTVVDSYSQTGFDGYYLKTTGVLSIDPSAIFTPTKDPSTITITRKGVTTQTNLFTFYYDQPLIGNPTVGSFVINYITDTSPLQISGVWVVQNTLKVNITINNINNIGQYYYNNTQIVSYYSTTGTVTAKETNLSNVTNLANIANNKISGSLNITALIPYTITNFSNVILLSCTVYNLTNSSVNSNVPTLKVISDNSTLPTNRIMSNASGSSIPSVPYNSSPYDNSVDITTNSELQFADNKFQTKTGSTTAYLNYSGTYYLQNSTNSLDYSGISSSGYRFAAFQFSTGPPSSGNYSSITFTVSGLSPGFSINASGLAFIGGEKILMYYRIGNGSLSTDGSTLVSNWISANDTSPSQVSSSNYYISGTSFYYGQLLNTSNSFKVGLPKPFNSTNITGSLNYYCIIGLPMSKQISFTSISASLSA